MRLGTTEHRPMRAEDRRIYEHAESHPSLMTPARRAALDALEREFHELLQAAPRERF